MRKLFAVPTENGKLCEHFGHCEKFAVVCVENGVITKNEFVTPPEHIPGLYPKFLADMGINTVIAGGMGQKARDLFAANNIEVFTGIDYREPDKLVESYLKKELVSTDSSCGHDHNEHNCE